MTLDSDQHVYNILMNNRSSALLSVAVNLKVFDFIHDNNPNAQELSAQFKFSQRGSDAVLVGLSALGLLESLEIRDHNDWYNHRYKLSHTAICYLTAGSPLYLGIL